MLQGWVIGAVSIAYLGVLFGIAWYGDRRADRGRSLIANPYVYALSLGVYATSWTFYGSVGRAASSGIGFLPIYLGPTLVAAVWFVVVGKIVAISKANRITSIADFIGSRYGKSALLAGLATVIAVVGIVPYISLQLKAVSNSFTVLTHYPDITMPRHVAEVPLLSDTGFHVALLLAAFAILFGTRHLDAAERHEGMVAAIAFESVVKLTAFLAVGAFVTFGMYGGFGDLFERAAARPSLAALMVAPEGPGGGDASWGWLIVLSMFAIILLPRQFQVAVVENVDRRHLRQASWLLPLYLLAMNLFVLPIAFGGLLHFPGGEVDADMFVLALPMAEHQQLLALAVFLGGLSAATGMIIVETVALSTMVSNDLVMPLLLRLRLLGAGQGDLARRLLAIRRGAIVAIVLLGYAYFRFAGEAYALVAIGLISFAAVAQFAPVMLGGLYWRHGTRAGAVAGLAAGFAVWGYTLLLPSFARSGWLPQSFLDEGPWGLDLLRPLQLFGLEGLDQTTHAMVWSMLANVSAYVLVSLSGRPDPVTRAQAQRFVEASREPAEQAAPWRGRVSLRDLEALLARFLGAARAREALSAYAARRGAASVEALAHDAALASFAETQLAGAIGSASARVMVASVVKEEAPGLEEVMSILDETSQAIAHSRVLEQKSRELEAATAELRAANARLREIDRMKDDFVSTVSHELRTPLTSIRAFAELLFDRPDTPLEKRQRFLGIILKETERLTRLINQILDLAKIESGRAEWHSEALDVRELVRDAAAAASQLFAERGVALETHLPERAPAVAADRDRLQQVLLNLLSNAVKFSPSGSGLVRVELRLEPGRVRVDVTDNGIGIDPREHQAIFEKFHQVGDTLTDRPRGTGLGLPISRRIVRQFGGELWVESAPGHGATFSFTLPLQRHPGGE
jgi:Na+/proline symporter/nitrogen-specific signal transduction histidine kinase